MPRRIEATDLWAKHDKVPPTNRIVECWTCGGRSFSFDRSLTIIDPRYVPGRCGEFVGAEKGKEKRCPGKIGRTVI